MQSPIKYTYTRAAADACRPVAAEAVIATAVVAHCLPFVLVTRGTPYMAHSHTRTTYFGRARARTRNGWRPCADTVAVVDVDVVATTAVVVTARRERDAQAFGFLGSDDDDTTLTK